MESSKLLGIICLSVKWKQTGQEEKTARLTMINWAWCLLLHELTCIFFWGGEPLSLFPFWGVPGLNPLFPNKQYWIYSVCWMDKRGTVCGTHWLWCRDLKGANDWFYSFGMGRLWQNKSEFTFIWKFLFAKPRYPKRWINGLQCIHFTSQQVAKNIPQIANHPLYSPQNTTLASI